ncbi:hypothetical protein DFH06DRAFT_1159968 [Mycena polygramma]|nr:hypothetical protein DFH06DRAFT_1159968 [Mycena polygramma]
MQSTLANTFGALYIAVILSTILYGVGVLQFWMYIRKYHSHDVMIVKCLVVVVLICDTCQQALVCRAVYLYLSDIGDIYLHLGPHSANIGPAVYEDDLFPSLDSLGTGSLMVPLFFSWVIATLVQQFYCWRIYKIGRSWVLAGAVSLLSGTACVMLLVYLVDAIELESLTDLMALNTLGIIANVLTTVVDITISVVLVVLLHFAKTGFKRTTDMINRLMIFAFNAGLPTSICAILNNICLIGFPNTFLYLFFFLLVGRLYTNSILVTLNCREYINSADQEEYLLEASGIRFAVLVDEDF